MDFLTRCWQLILSKNPRTIKVLPRNPRSCHWKWKKKITVVFVLLWIFSRKVSSTIKFWFSFIVKRKEKEVSGIAIYQFSLANESTYIWLLRKNWFPMSVFFVPVSSWRQEDLIVTLISFLVEKNFKFRILHWIFCIDCLGKNIKTSKVSSSAVCQRGQIEFWSF